MVSQRFVRREKEISDTRMEVAQVEALRYKQRMEYLEGELKELQESLSAEREKLQVITCIVHMFQYRSALRIGKRVKKMTSPLIYFKSATQNISSTGYCKDLGTAGRHDQANG